MKLNNQGWGLREMLLLCAILLFCVLLVATLINNLYEGLASGNNNTTSSNAYTKVERSLASAARIYSRRYEVSNNLIISEDLLDVGYITEEELMVEDDVCTGYVLVNEDKFTPFISCQNYETEGY